MKTRVWSVIAALAAAGGCFAAAAQAADAKAGALIAAQGAQPDAPACTTCHGVQGEGQADSGFPRLAGQNADYLTNQLDALASGARDNPIMSPIAKALSPQQQADVSSYFASLPLVASPGAPTLTTKARDEGRDLARYGDWSNGVPACARCHGPSGEGVGDVAPRLAGQGATYIVNTFDEFRSGARHNDPLGLMRGIAAKLSKNQIAAVADYYGALPSAPTATGGVK